MWCRRCSREVRIESGRNAPSTCPFCGGNVEAVSSQSQAIRRAREILEKWQSTDLFDRINAGSSAAGTEQQSPVEMPGLKWDPQVPAAAGIPSVSGGTSAPALSTGGPAANLTTLSRQIPGAPSAAASIIRTVPPLPTEILAGAQSNIATTAAGISASAMTDVHRSEHVAAAQASLAAVADFPGTSGTIEEEDDHSSAVQLSQDDSLNDALDLMFQNGELFPDQSSENPLAVDAELTTTEEESIAPTSSTTADFTADAEFTELPPGIQPQAVESASSHFPDGPARGPSDVEQDAAMSESSHPLGSEPVTDRLEEPAEPIVSSAAPAAEENPQFTEANPAADSSTATASTAVFTADTGDGSGIAEYGNEVPGRSAVSELDCHRHMFEQQLTDQQLQQRSSGSDDEADDEADDKADDEDLLPSDLVEMTENAAAVSETQDDDSFTEDEQPLRILRLEHEAAPSFAELPLLQSQPETAAAASAFKSAGPGRGGIMTSIIGQTLAYLGVLGLTGGGCIVVYGHFGGHPDFTPTGWLVTMVSQMLLFLGVINLVTGGIEQSTEQLNSRMASMSDHIQRLEQMNRELLQQSGTSGTAPVADNGQSERHAESA